MLPRVIWVTGAGGLIGHYFVATAPESFPSARVIPLTRSKLELTDFEAVRQAFKQEAPALVVHCAALSRSPECQANPALARKVNVEVTALLADLAERLVFFSTDLVFDGRAGNYAEADGVNPLSIYAETKVAAEHLVLAHPNHLVVRTSLNCGPSPTGDRGCEEQLRLGWQSGQILRLFVDEFRSPIPATATARAVWELIAQGSTGLFHVAGAERLSRWEIGQLFAARYPQWHPRIEKASLHEYRGAPRPPDTSLNCAKAQAVLSFPLPRLSQWVTAAV